MYFKGTAKQEQITRTNSVASDSFTSTFKVVIHLCPSPSPSVIYSPLFILRLLYSSDASSVLSTLVNSEGETLLYSRGILNKVLRQIF